MPINPITGLMEEDELEGVLSKADADRAKLLEEQGQYDTTGAITGALASLGAAFQGKDSMAAANQVMQGRREADQNKLSALDKWKQGKIAEIQAKREGVKAKRDDQAYTQDQEKIARERDPNSEESKIAREAAIRMGFKGDPNSITAERFKSYSPALEKMYAVEQARLSRSDAKVARQTERQEKLNEKLNDREAKLAVPGYTRDGSVLPKEEEAMKFRKATAVADQLKQKLNRVKQLVKESGSFEYGGDNGQEMETLATEIQLLGKSPELYELGVLTGPDLSLLNKITADPASLSSMFTRDSTRQKQLDTQISSIENKLGATAKSLGYASAGKSQGPMSSSNQDSEAVAWAMANPSDPRAIKIMQHNQTKQAGR